MAKMSPIRRALTAPDPSPAHERKESPATERREHRTGQEAADAPTINGRKALRRGGVRKSGVRGRRGR